MEIKKPVKNRKGKYRYILSEENKEYKIRINGTLRTWQNVFGLFKISNDCIKKTQQGIF